MRRDLNGAQYRGPLAGVTAGAMAVLVIGGGLLLLAWHQIASTVGLAGKLMIWGLVLLWFAVVAYAVAWLFLRLRLHLHQPETLRGRTIRAEVVTPGPPVLSSQPVAELAPPESHVHLHGPLTEADAAEVAAVEQAGYQAFGTYSSEGR
jgi:hypothetical protein